jgi:phenylacetate-coenzyme A ligase PaaK-like adenylate-forming protein
VISRTDDTLAAFIDALREELGVTPTLRLEPYGTLERSTFKAARIVDES